jgi:hypothetical protein
VADITLATLQQVAEELRITLSSAAESITKSVASLAQARDIGVGMVIKANESKQFLLTVAYPAWKPDSNVAADGHIDVASADVVEKACWRFMKKGARVGMWHEPGHEDAAEVVENYIWRGDPWVVKSATGTEQLVMPGDWLVGLRLADRPWKMYKADLIGGVSVQGGARRSLPTENTLAEIRRRNG